MSKSGTYPRKQVFINHPAITGVDINITRLPHIFRCLPHLSCGLYFSDKKIQEAIAVSGIVGIKFDYEYARNQRGCLGSAQDIFVTNSWPAITNRCQVVTGLIDKEFGRCVDESNKPSVLCQSTSD